MFRTPKIILSDFFGLIRACGFPIAFGWLANVIFNVGECKRAGNLQPADEAMGEGPFEVRLGNATAKLVGFRALTGIREIWVRNVYLNDFLAVPPDATVVDLGCNCGMFTALALGHSPGVRVIAVEADPRECKRLNRTLAENNWQSRVQLINAFVGGKSAMETGIREGNQSEKIPWIGEDQIMNPVGSSRIALLKCDIEGSEFDLFKEPSRLLDASDQIAMEIHPSCGNAPALIARLRAMGFELQIGTYPPTQIVRARRRAPK